MGTKAYRQVVQQYCVSFLERTEQTLIHPLERAPNKWFHQRLSESESLLGLFTET